METKQNMCPSDGTLLIMATNNAHKLQEVREILGDAYVVKGLADIGCNEDIPEDADTLEGNALQKARYVHEHYGVDCFADDTGLEVDCLNGEPGVYSARYAGEPKDPVKNVQKLLKELEGVPFARRTARFRCVVALIENGELTTFEGRCEGHIALEPQGELGFGYDPIFVPEGMEKTMAMLTLEEKNAISHRGKAMEQLSCHLLKKVQL